MFSQESFLLCLSKAWKENVIVIALNCLCFGLYIFPSYFQSLLKLTGWHGPVPQPVTGLVVAKHTLLSEILEVRSFLWNYVFSTCLPSTLFLVHAVLSQNLSSSLRMELSCIADAHGFMLSLFIYVNKKKKKELLGRLYRWLWLLFCNSCNFFFYLKINTFLIKEK